MRSWRNTEWVIGNPYNPAVIPFDCSYQSYKMTFMQRLKNIWDWAFDIWYYYHVISPKIDKLSEKYFPTITSRTKLSLMFVNSHSALNPRPLLPKVISIGGIHMPFAKPLPKVKNCLPVTVLRILLLLEGVELVCDRLSTVHG